MSIALHMASSARRRFAQQQKGHRHLTVCFAAGWNILDGTVVAMGYVDVLMSGSSVTALRAVRVLRPLRTITHIKGLRVGAQHMLARQLADM
jgi:hypothetical protein